MDHMSKEDPEEMIISWSKECLFSHREGVVDKENLYCSFVSWSGQDIYKQIFFTLLGRSPAWKTFPFFKKTKKIIKRKKCHVFCGVGINTEEAVLIMSETVDDIQGRNLLITTEKKKKPCNENEEAKLEIIDNCEESDDDEVVIIENGNFETVSDFSVVDKNSSILKNKNIDIVGELQSSCSFSMTRNIGNSVDDVPKPLKLAAVKVIMLKIMSAMISLKKKLVDIVVVMKIVIITLIIVMIMKMYQWEIKQDPFLLRLTRFLVDLLEKYMKINVLMKREC